MKYYILILIILLIIYYLLNSNKFFYKQKEGFFNNNPKHIFILWFQGFENAPFIVKKCLESWKLKNPTWKIIELDDNNISDYINIEKDSVSRSFAVLQSTLIRFVTTN